MMCAFESCEKQPNTNHTVTRRMMTAVVIAMATVLVATPLVAQSGAAVPEVQASTFPVGEVVPDIASLSDPEQTYALYLPEAYDPGRSWPVLFLLDPSGIADRALELFREGAEDHGWIVLSTYNSRSDQYNDSNTPAFHALVDDAQRRYAIDSHRIYLAGMSGTAKVCWPFARMLEGNVAGVIGTGGALDPDVPLGDHVSFAFYGIAGTTDFNYREMRELDLDLEGLGAPHRLEIFEGPHGWGPAAANRAAIEWMEIIAMKRGLRARDEDIIARRWAADLAVAEAVDATVDPLGAWNRFDQLVRDFEGLRDVGMAVAMRDGIDKRALKRSRAAEKKLLNAERAYRERIQTWLHRLAQAGDAVSREQATIDLGVAGLKRQAGAVESADERSAQRRLETLFVNTAFYLPQAFRIRNRLDRVQLMLEIAAEVKPDSPYPFWYLAGLHSERGDLDAAFDALDRATGLGTVDLERLVADERWTPLRDDPRWAALLARLGRV